ncbi:hypothetical protein MCAMS1_00891 [biofilm metagenome]
MQANVITEQPIRLGYIKLPIIALALACLFINDSHGSILTFDQFRNASGSVVPTISGNGPESDYGDNITGSPMNVPGGQYTYGNGGEGFTPNISVDFFAGNNNVSLWQGGYGDLTNVLIGDNNSNSLNIRFIAEPGFAVLFYGFDIGGWFNTDYTINAITLTNGSATLFSQNNTLVEGNFSGPRHSSFQFGTPFSSTELVLQIDFSNLSGSQHDNIGVDNVRFGQQKLSEVPLPGAFFLFFSGMMAIALRRFRLSR